MEDITDAAFRRLCFNHGADIVFTEMARTDALARKNAATWSRLDVKDDTPTIIQLLVGKPAGLGKFLGMFEPQGNFQGFNLNLGCPSPDVISIGQGCAMMKRVTNIQKYISLISDKGYPVSVKMRLGLNKYEKEKKVYLNLLKGTDADFYVVHARHGGERYSDPADFGVYQECVDTGKLIIANGDIDTVERVEELRKIGVKGVMIGRKATSDPAIFNRLKGKKNVGIDSLKEEYLRLAELYGTRIKYSQNVLKRLGSSPTLDDNMLV
jgi:tRNA-dihydrouridine synthase